MKREREREKDRKEEREREKEREGERRRERERDVRKVLKQYLWAKQYMSKKYRIEEKEYQKQEDEIDRHPLVEPYNSMNMSEYN